LEPTITPLPLPQAPGRVLLFGGMFDPPHLGHTALAGTARDLALGPDGWLVFIPAAASPLKSEAPAAAPRHRLAMLRLATAGISRAAIWTDELDRAVKPAPDGPAGARSPDAPAALAPSFWVDTLRRARAILPPQTDLRFLIGADQALRFHDWRDFREILQLARPVVMLRWPDQSSDALLDTLRATGVWDHHELNSWRGAILPMPLAAASSTRARQYLQAGDRLAAAELLDPAVLRYIQDHQLYIADSRRAGA
jgi:nicotinate-nucleotide adenylyltransferase